MNHMTNYLKNKVLDTNLSGVYIALFNGDSEINKAGYSRQSAIFTASEEGQSSNNSDILFPIAQQDWGPITHIGIADSSSSGNLLWKAPAEFVKNVGVSSQYKIPQNYLIVRLR